MFRFVLSIPVIVLTILVAAPFARAADYPPELTPMVKPLEEVEAMMADGTCTDGEFNPAVDGRDASTCAKTSKKKLRTAK